MIAENVKRIARAQGKTLEDLAAALNVTRQQIHRYITGNVTLQNLQRIAAALNTSPAALLAETEPAPAAGPASLADTTDRPSQDPGAPALVCPVCGSRFELCRQAPGIQEDAQPRQKKHAGPRKAGQDTDGKLFD